MNSRLLVKRWHQLSDPSVLSDPPAPICPKLPDILILTFTLPHQIFLVLMAQLTLTSDSVPEIFTQPCHLPNLLESSAVALSICTKFLLDGWNTYTLRSPRLTQVVILKANTPPHLTGTFHRAFFQCFPILGRDSGAHVEEVWVGLFLHVIQPNSPNLSYHLPNYPHIPTLFARFLLQLYHGGL